MDSCENFPVASRLLPRRLRAPAHLIRDFARAADELARDGDADPQARLAALQAYELELGRIAAGAAPLTPQFCALATAIAHHRLPLDPFYSLLSAMRQDATQASYADFGALMDYCRRRSNPMGRLLLALLGDDDPRHQAYADALSTSLQLITFLQGIAADLARGRIYLPQDELRQYGILRQHLRGELSTPLLDPFMRAQIERARRLLQAGAPLGLALPGRAGLEVRLIVARGERILRRLHASPAAVLKGPVRLGAWDGVMMRWRALTRR